MIAQIVWTSIASSSFQVLFTLAFALVLRVTGIWNFTQPALMGIAFYAGYVVRHWLGWTVFPAFIVSAALTMLAAVALERFAFTHLRRQQSEPLLYFIVTLVISQFVAFLLNLLFTSEPVYMSDRVGSALLLVEPVIISAWDVWAMVLTIAGVAVLALFLRTRIGQHLVAVADNPDLAEVFGVRKNLLYMVAFAIAGLLITLGTFVYAGKLTFYPDLGLNLMIFAVASTILAGIGRVFGAAVAAVVISVLQQASVYFISSQWQSLIVFGVLFGAIIVFPKGVHLPQPRLTRKAATPLMAGTTPNEA